MQLGTTALQPNGPGAVAKFKTNYTITVVTATGSYIATIADWDAMNAVLTSANGMANFNQKKLGYLGSYPLASEAEVSEYALMKTFGSSINLYKAGLTGELESLKLRTADKSVIDPCI